MLLQIAEPGAAPTKAACKKRVVGIDLGTTNSLVAHVADARPAVLAGDAARGDRAILPSVVSFQPDGAVLVGDAAIAAGLDHPEETVASSKRLIGRSFADLAGIAALVPNQLVDDAGRMVKLRLGGGREVSPVQVAAEILKELRRRAEAELGGDLDGAVITVPAYFDDAQRQATRDAGRLAGLEVLRLLAEPTAAALAYGLDRGTRGTYAIYDLGGGTFDISILTLVDGVFEVRATGGDSALGGDDLDRAIVAELAGEVPAARDRAERRAVAAALAAARAAKEALTDGEEAGVAFELDGRAIERVLTRADLARIAAPLLERAAKACRRTLKDSGFAAADLDGVVLVGGSTRSPVVRDHVRAVFGREPLCELDPDQVVALGAAVQADVLAGGETDVVLLDVVPLSLGIETMGGVVEKLIPRNSTIPCGATQTFTTHADQQTGFDLHVVQGERETADACRSLARFQLRGIPPLVAGAARVEITFVVDADGILRVSAKEQLSGLEAAIDVKPSYGLTDEEVERMLVESFEHAEEDLAARNLRVERVEAERILAATRAAMAQDAHLLDADVEAATREAIGVLEAAAGGTDHLAIRAAIEALDRASKPFAERRMNLAIAAAMQGRDLATVERELADHDAQAAHGHAGHGHGAHGHGA
ncbi:MAG TPA: Fe-S protein assembly chaperone HscA [Kofleriaceae bacterium]|nr:Fe-S protein assembly chaperone HscA [Kofleriaceae bacterium]